MYNGTEFYYNREYEGRTVDRFGSGDSFARALFYGLVTGIELNEAAEFGVAVSVLKHTLEGDLNHTTLSDGKGVMKGDASGRVVK